MKKLEDQSSRRQRTPCRMIVDNKVRQIIKYYDKLDPIANRNICVYCQGVVYIGDWQYICDNCSYKVYDDIYTIPAEWIRDLYNKVRETR